MSEVESNNRYNSEKERFLSFTGTGIDIMLREALTLTGFHYKGPDYKIECHFCNMEIVNYSVCSKSAGRHQNKSSLCPLIRGLETDNIPIVPGQLSAYLDFIDPTEDLSIPTTRIFLEQGGTSSIYVPTETPCFPKFFSEQNRLDTYEDWPQAMYQRPAELSHAGFFYTGTGDNVICFSCGVGLRNWFKFDDPWEQHATWRGKCSFLTHMKGLNYIKQIQIRAKDDVWNSGVTPI